MRLPYTREAMNVIAIITIIASTCFVTIKGVENASRFIQNDPETYWIILLLSALVIATAAIAIFVGGMGILIFFDKKYHKKRGVR